MLEKYGSTYLEIAEAFPDKCILHYDTSFQETDTATETAHIIKSFSEHLKKDKIKYVFIHGDRSEAMAGAIAATFNNTPIAHIEAGDLSGSVDESLRHAITKLSHSFFVADTHAKQVLIQLGENQNDIHIVGNSSLANNFTHNADILEKHNIPFSEYGILIYHPVTTQSKISVATEIKDIMDTLTAFDMNYIVIYPNNDFNSDIILKEYEKHQLNPHFCFFKSLPLNDFHELLMRARFLIGNSSCGIKEAPFYHIPVIDIGTRQKNRYKHLNYEHLYHADNKEEIQKHLKRIQPHVSTVNLTSYREEFFERLKNIFQPSYWDKTTQKEFIKNSKSNNS